MTDRALEKRVKERVEVILGDPVMLSIYREFGFEAFSRSSVFYGLPKFLKENAVKGNTCVEIGTWNGISAIALANHFDRVVTLDIVNNTQKNKIIEHAGMKDKIRCLNVKNNAEKREAVKALDFDCAYLDGDHAADTLGDFGMVRRCKRVIFHEVWPDQQPVWELVRSLPPEQVRYGAHTFAIWDARRK